MLADDGDAGYPDHLLDLISRPPTHARDERIATDEARELAPRLVRHARVLWPVDDRRQRAVDVQQHGGPLGLCREQAERVVGHGRPRIRAVRSERLPMTARLALIGLVAGIFSTLFGVGGGIIVVPLLVALAAFPAHTAAATSLGAILVTAAAGAVLYAVRGEVRPAYAALVGIPAVAGALVGTHVQQRLSGRSLALAFAGLLVVIGVWLIAG